jgi:hypothetical protein
LHLSTSSDAQIASVLEAYGMGYVAHANGADDKNIADCPQYFPSSDRNKWHSFDGEFYYIDASGRPQRAYKYFRRSALHHATRPVRATSVAGATPRTRATTTTVAI